MKSANVDNLIKILREAREFLARPGNNFDRSPWKDAPTALREVDGLILRLEAGDLPERSAINVLFFSTGSIRDVAESNGWGQEFPGLAKRCDHALNKVYGMDAESLARHRTEMFALMREGVDGRLRWLFLFFFVLSTGYNIYLRASHETPEIYYPVRMSGESAWYLLVFASIFFGVMTIVNWVWWFKRKKAK